MKKMGTVPAFVLLAALAGRSQCPGVDPGVLSMGDGKCPPASVLQKVPVAYVNVREADVMWSKRIWRTIDLREKMNQPLYYPTEPNTQCRCSLFDLIKYHALIGEITAYGNAFFDDEFNTPLTIAELKALLSHKDTIPRTLLDGTQRDTVITTEINSEQVKKYWIKEDWFFDKQRSVMDVRIIGICPLVDKVDRTTGDVRGISPLFWVYFPQCRPYFARTQVLLPVANNAEMRSFDEIFAKRLFYGVIHKESNVYNRTIQEYAIGMDALLESERIKEGMMHFESDLWHY